MSLQATSETTSTCARTSPLIRVIIRTFILTLTMGFKLASANATGDSPVAVVRSAINEAVPVFQNRVSESTVTGSAAQPTASCYRSQILRFRLHHALHH